VVRIGSIILIRNGSMMVFTFASRFETAR